MDWSREALCVTKPWHICCVSQVQKPTQRRRQRQCRLSFSQSWMRVLRLVLQKPESVLRSIIPQTCQGIFLPYEHLCMICCLCKGCTVDILFWNDSSHGCSSCSSWHIKATLDMLHVLDLTYRPSYFRYLKMSWNILESPKISWSVQGYPRFMFFGWIYLDRSNGRYACWLVWDMSKISIRYRRIAFS